MATNDASYDLLDLEARAYAKTAPDLGIPLNGSAAFSVAAWVKLDGLCSGASILSKDGVFDFGISGDQLLLSIAGFPPLESNPRKQPLDHLAWHYLAATFSEGEARLYIDGVFNAMQATSGSGSSNQNPFLIGKGLQAHVRSLRVYKVALTPDAVMANMFEPAEAGTLAADFDFSQTPPVDKGPGKLPITLEEGARMIRSTPALSLSGTAFAGPLSEEEVNPGGGQVDPYTVQAWVYVEADALPEGAIFVNSNLESATGMALYLEEDATAGGFRVVSQRGSVADEESLTSTEVVKKGEWTNVATTFDGTTLAIYINGNPVGSGPFGPIPLRSSAGRLLVGAALSEEQAFATMTLQGYISRLEVWDVALSATEVATYMGAMPGMGAEGLTACYDFTNPRARNMLDAHPVGLADGADITEQVQPATAAGTSPTTWGQLEPPAALDAETIRSLCESIDLSELLDSPEFEEAMEADAAAFAGRPEDQELVRVAWRGALDQLREDPTGARFFLSTHVVGDEYVGLCHRRGETYVAYRIGVEEIDECTLWMVNLVFIVVAGALDALFGLRPVLKTGAINLIQSVLNKTGLATMLSRGRVMTAGGIFLIVVALYDEGTLKELLKMMVEIGFWALLRVVAKLALKLVGIGAADVIASLVATAATFILEYARQPASCSPPTTVDLSAIQFDYASKAGVNDALAIRRNATTQVPDVQWRKGMTKAEDSQAAYAISRVQGKPVTMRAGFLSSGNATSVQVKADGGGVLGAIDPFTVNFKNGKSDPQYVEVNLNHHQLASGGIQRQDVEWSWSYLPPGGSWTPMATTSHRIYALLDAPTGPWQQAPATGENTQLPWTDVLDYACEWAKGKTTATDAASSITAKVNESIKLKYEVVDGKGAYTMRDGRTLERLFDCTRFIDFLKTGKGNGAVVNCSDCAAMVTTFANSVGCNLFASRMGPTSEPGFKCNMIQAIGYTNWAYPLPKIGGRFGYHEVAWSGPGTSNYKEPVFDACLKVDGGNNPWDWTNPSSPSHSAMLPANVKFTVLEEVPTSYPQPPFTEASYRERLALNSAEGIGRCGLLGPFPYSGGGRRRVV